MTQSNSNNNLDFSIYLDIATKLFSVIAGFTAIAYVLGFIITNTYLLQYGFFTFELFQTHYLASGFMYVVLNLVILSEPIYDIIILRRVISVHKKLAGVRFLKNSAVSFIWLLFVIFAFSIFVNIIPASAIIRPSVNIPDLLVIDAVQTSASNALLLFSRLAWWGVFIIFLVKWSTWSFFRQKFITKLEPQKSNLLLWGSPFLTFVSILGFPWLILTIVFYSIAVYPVLPPAFGGGASNEVRLLADISQVGYFDLLGIHDHTLSSTSSNVVSTIPVLFVGKTDKQYFILISDRFGILEAASVNADIIKGIKFVTPIQTKYVNQSPPVSTPSASSVITTTIP